LDYKVQASVINWQALINLRSDCSLPHLCSAPHLSSQPSGSTAPLRSRSSSQLDTHSYNLRSRGVSTNMVLQPNNKRSGSALFYSSTKQKMERFCSACQTQNEIAQFLETGMEPLHPSWLPNQTHPKSITSFVLLLLRVSVLLGSF
jgi:hypothetical protein